MIFSIHFLHAEKHKKGQPGKTRTEFPQPPVTRLARQQLCPPRHQQPPNTRRNLRFSEPEPSKSRRKRRPLYQLRKISPSYRLLSAVEKTTRLRYAPRKLDTNGGAYQFRSCFFNYTAIHHQQIVTKIAAVKIRLGISQPLLRAVSIVNTNRTIPVVYDFFVSGNEYRYSRPALAYLAGASVLYHHVLPLCSSVISSAFRVTPLCLAFFP